jgi:hypothetical protein
MSVSPGDIIRRSDGSYWAVVELVASVPRGSPPDCLISDGDGMVLQVGTGGLDVVGSATFEEGQEVRFQFGRRGYVARDEGDYVQIADEREVASFFRKRSYLTPVPRGSLTSYNLGAVIKALDLS